jgi:hypothetical protein
MVKNHQFITTLVGYFYTTLTPIHESLFWDIGSRSSNVATITTT